MDELVLLRASYGTAPPDRELVTVERAKLDALIASSDGPNTSLPRRWTRHRTAIIAVAPIGLALAAAGWAVLASDPTDATTMLCSVEDDLYGIANDGTPPTEACAAVWVDASVAPNLAAVPTLTTCVDDSGVITVIAGENSTDCEQADMSPWSGQGDYLQVGLAIADARVALGIDDPNPPTPERCVSDTEWREALQQQLDRRSLTGWDVITKQIPENEPCFLIFEVDPATRSVTLLQSRA